MSMINIYYNENPCCTSTNERENALKNWVQQANGTEESSARERAAQRILECYRTQSQTLNLANLGLTTIQGLDFSAFRIVDLSQNRITSIADINFRGIHNLNLNKNCIQSIEGFHFSEMMSLDLSENKIKTIKNSSFRSVRDLYLNNNCISILENVDFSSVRWINFSLNRIRSFASVNLNQVASLWIQFNPVSPFAIAQLQNSANVTAGYNDCSLTDELDIEKKYPNITHHSKFEILKTFINRLVEIKDFQNTPTQVFQSLTEILDFSESNVDFREFLFMEVQEATSDCADRPTFYFSRILAQLGPSKAEKNGLKDVFKAILHLEKVRIIEEYATKVGKGESIELALWLQLQLLPHALGIQSMINTKYVVESFKNHQELLEETSRLIHEATDCKTKQIAIVAKSDYFRKKRESHREYLELCDRSTDALNAVEETPQAYETISEITNKHKADVDAWMHQQAELFVTSLLSETF